MGKRTDILEFMAKIVDENTHAYKDDLQYDIKTIIKSAQVKENTAFYWMSRPHGTWLVRERDVFLRGSEANSIWTHYGSSPEGILTYRFSHLEYVSGSVIGDAAQLDYTQQVRRIEKAALPIAAVELVFSNSISFKIPYYEFEYHRTSMYEQYGKPERVRYLPENEYELAFRIALEEAVLKASKPDKITSKHIIDPHCNR